MSFRRIFYCPNCGTQTRKVRLDETDVENTVDIDCEKCHILTKIILVGSGDEQAKIEFYDRHETGKTLYCPCCGHFPLKKVLVKKDEYILECTQCTRIFELEYD
jgi:transcription elongation factor Elf1